MGNSIGVIQPAGDPSSYNGNIFNFVQNHRNKVINQKKFRYMGGKTFLKFYREDTWPLVEETFERLNISEIKGYELFRTFAMIDQNENGKISLNEIFHFLNFPRTKFTERLFDFTLQETRDPINTHFHNFAKKELTFLEFAIRIWNFCTLKNEGLARYLFEIFDIQESFYLSKNHLITMYHMLYNTPNEDIPIINDILTRGEASLSESSVTPAIGNNATQVHKVPINFNNIELIREILSFYQFIYDEKVKIFVITKDSFIETCCKKTYLLEPIIKYQKHLQKRIGGGILFWRSLIHYRYHHPMITAYDFKCNTLQDSIDNIISSVDDFVSTKKVRENQTSEALLRSRSEKLAQDKIIIERELTVREKQLQADTQRANNNELLLKMQRKWEAYNKAKEAFIKEEFTTQDIWHRREIRLKLYDYLDAAIAASREYYEWKDRRDVEIMEGSDLDHETRFQDFINNRMIQGHYDPRLGTSGGGLGGDTASVISGFAGNTASSGKPGSGSNAEASLLSHPDEAIFNQIIMNNGQFIYNLLCLIKLYDIVLTNLQTEMESDPRKQNPTYKEKELTIYNTLVRLQQHYSLFKLLQPDDYAQKNPLEASSSSALPDPQQQGSMTLSGPLAGGSHISGGGNTATRGDQARLGSEGAAEEGLNSLEAILQKNEKQTKMLKLIEDTFEEEKKLIKKYEKKTDHLLAEKLAKEELLKELKEKVMKMCYKTIHKSQIAREKNLQKEEFDLMMNQGSRITRWEYVLEKDQNRYFYVNIDTLEFKHPKTAICEWCDAIIIQNELKCDNCEKYRSPKNKLLYRPLGYKDITQE